MTQALITYETGETVSCDLCDLQEAIDWARADLDDNPFVEARYADVYVAWGEDSWAKHSRIHRGV